MSLSQETIQYPCFKPEIFSQTHKDPDNWNESVPKNLKNFKKKLQVLFKKML